MLRPHPASWFEVLCPRGDSARVTGVLARTGAVEIEVRKAPSGELRLSELDRSLAAYRALLPTYRRYWARGSLARSPGGMRPREALAAALGRIDSWRSAADPLIGRLQACEDEHMRLDLCAEVMRALSNSPLDFGALSGAGPFLARVAAFVPETAALDADGPWLHLDLPLDGRRYLLGLGPAPAMAALGARIQALGGRLLLPPPWLRGDAVQAAAQIRARVAILEREIAELYARLDRLYGEYGLGEALGDISCLEWFTNRVGVLELASERFALATGWTRERDAGSLVRALEQEGVAALVRLRPPPPDTTPPLLLDNPAWARPFEVFARALGVPGASEADPSPLLALIVPVMFGYMFGDLGQGLLLLGAGWLLRRRLALAPLIMAGGAAAALFGLAFGSLFGLEGLLPALWLHPLQYPVTVLALPLLPAVALLVLGQLLNALQAHWRGALRQ
ncbi:MAG: ATPase, partial [Terriglobia bacterium]